MRDHIPIPEGELEFNLGTSLQLYEVIHSFVKTHPNTTLSLQIRI